MQRLKVSDFLFIILPIIISYRAFTCIVALSNNQKHEYIVTYLMCMYKEEMD